MIEIILLFDWLDRKKGEKFYVKLSLADELCRQGIAEAYDPTAVRFAAQDTKDEQWTLQNGNM